MKWAGVIVAAAISAASCGGGGSSSTTVLPITVSVSASSVSLGSGQSSTLTAAVANDASGAGVTWSMPAGSPGTLTTTDSLHATYAVGTVSQSGSVVIAATSKADATKTASVTITLTASTSITVSVSPATSDIGPTAKVSLLASLANDSKSQGVTWSLASGAAGTLATVDTTHATYTAPATVSAASSVTVTATSVTDTTKTGTATINLHPISVTMGTPATASVGPLQTSVVTATTYDAKGVTWTASSGTITDLAPGCPNGQCQAIYTAPADISAAGTATITATAASDNTKTDSKTVALTAASFWEDLVAYDNGLNLGVVKPYADLEQGGANTSGIFQPDRLIFHEIATGANGQPINTEIWRLDNDNPIANPASSDNPPSWFIPGVLNRTPWNANGTEILLTGNPCVPESYHHTGQPAGEWCDQHLYMFDTAGDLQELFYPHDAARGSNSAQLAIVGSDYLPWDQSNPNLVYLVTSGDTQAGSGETASGLYSIDVSNDFAMKEIAPLDNAPLTDRTDPVTGQPIAKEMQSYLSNDDVALVQDVNPPPVSGTLGPFGCTAAPGCPDYIPNIYMVDVNSAHIGTTYGTVIYHYPINFPNLSDPCVTGYSCGANIPASAQFSTSDQFHFHDIYFQRDAGDHFLFNYGPRASVGEYAFFQASLDGNTVVPAYPDPVIPGVPYFSHPADNFDGTLVSFAGYDTFADESVNGSTGFGVWVRTIPASGYNGGTVSGSLGPEYVNHQGWDGYDPNYVAFDGYLAGLPAAYISQGYPSLAAFQACVDNSPPATCVAPYGQMSDNPADPNGGTVRVLVNDGPRDEVGVLNGSKPSIIYGPAQSPDATKVLFTLPASFSNLYAPLNTYIAVDHRPFPPALTASGNVLTWTPYLTHREVAGYHVYRSTDSKTWTEVTASCSGFTAAAFNSLNATTCTDSSAASGTTYYYGVTAQEYSGLESGMLSNVVQVTAGGGAGTTTTAQGTTGFDATPPAPPTGLTVTKMTNSGEWKLTWTASTSPDLRYYDIFYSGGGVPQVSTPLQAQHYLIDSPAANQTSYIYWEANPNDVPVFGIVAVDRQDNFSSLACIATANPTAPCP